MLEKTYKPENVEKRIYDFWMKQKLFTPKIDPKKKPFTILLPPPNANDPLHVGHALYVVEDILCRYHHLLGDPTLFLPGTDHAGIETQYVFEKSLAKKGKSRFDFDQKTLYQMINDFVEENRGIAKQQLKRLGFSLDWTREKYTLNPDILKTVLQTFEKLHKDGLIYRAERIVNYCTHCGTAFSNLEVKHIQSKDILYYLNYGPINIATTRPETIFADVAVAVSPKDKRYKKLIGKQAILPILNKELPIITDELVDMEFGTSALKITPGHDVTDFEIGQKHNLEVIKTIDSNGKMINLPDKYLGMSVIEARKAIVNDLEKSGKLLKTETLDHSIAVCYRCNNIIEPMLMPQWFVQAKPLAMPAIKVVKKGELKILPKRFEKLYFHWMENIRDWNISRQIVWGPRIPAWYCLECNPQIAINFINKKGENISGIYAHLKNEYDFAEIEKGLQRLTAPKDAVYSLDNKPCKKCSGKKILQETDTFDTWFSSGQWPLTTLGFPDSEDFKYFYPTSVLDTMWDILFFWVARMVMFGIYRTGKTPFKVAHMHCRIVDAKGQKMSKSKNNVINPMEMIEKYGADALRMALVFGAAPGSDICLGQDKIKAMRNFSNKLWNAARFIKMNREIRNPKHEIRNTKNKDDKWILKELNKVIKKTTKYIDKYRFDLAAYELYHFFWHVFCDKYIETTKNRREQAQPVLLQVLKSCLIMLHPFMPFITEEIYQKLPNKKEKSIMLEKWPTT